MMSNCKRKDLANYHKQTHPSESWPFYDMSQQGRAPPDLYLKEIKNLS